MAQRKALRTLIRSLIILLLLVAAGYGATLWLERAVLQRSARILTELGGPGSTTTIGNVEVHLFAGDIQWSDVRITGRDLTADGTPLDGDTRLRGRIDTISVRGLSIWQLLVRHGLSARTIAIQRPHLDLFLSHDTAEAEEEAAEEVEEEAGIYLRSIKADSLRVTGGAFHLSQAADSATLWVDTLDLAVTALRSTWRKRAQTHFDDAEMILAGIHGLQPHVYDLRVRRMQLLKGAGMLRVTGTTLRPLTDPEHHAKLFKYETDYFETHIDTMQLEAFQPLRLLNERIFKARHFSINGVALTIHRDKTLPNDPHRYVRMPARLVREMPLKLCLDTLRLDRCTIVYHEKGERSPEYGEVTFNDLHAMITGLCAVEPTMNDTVVVRAEAMGYDQAKVRLVIRTIIADSSDRFQARAAISALPIRVFNNMTEELMLAKATGGTIGGIDMTMSANNEEARGRVDVEYDRLSFELLKADGSGESRRFLTSLANLVVRKRNARSDPNFRHGDYTVQRNKDRSIFNYLWIGLREGMVVSALPGVVDKARQIERPKKP